MRILLVILSFFYTGALSALEIEMSMTSKYLLKKNKVEPTAFILKGRIEKGDLKKIQNFLKSKQGKNITFSINSNGGDVIEAINIGLFFRDIFMEIDVEEQCDSSCFYILVGSYRRTTAYPVGIHRPYFEANQYANLSPKESEEAFAKVIKSVKDYLEQVHVSPAIVDGMMKASPRELMFIQPENFTKLIGVYSPVKSDWLTAKCDNRTQSELDQWRLISDMNKYEFILKQTAQLVQTPMELFESVQTLNQEYQETIDAHNKNTTLSIIAPTYIKKNNDIKNCKRQTMFEERKNILNSL